MNKRRIISLTPLQTKWLKAESKRRTLSMTAVIRRLIDRASGSK